MVTHIQYMDLFIAFDRSELNLDVVGLHVHAKYLSLAQNVSGIRVGSEVRARASVGIEVGWVDARASRLFPPVLCRMQVKQRRGRDATMERVCEMPR